MKNKFSVVILFLVTILTCSCSNYGTRLEFNGGELFYTPSISTEEAKKLGTYLVETGFFNGDNKAVRINKTGEIYEFSYILRKGIPIDDEFRGLTKHFANNVSEGAMNNARVDIVLCDKGFKVIEKVPFTKRENAKEN